MIKTSKFTLDPGEIDPICVRCKQTIVYELAEISTAPGYYHKVCGLMTENNHQKRQDDVNDFMSDTRDYAKSKGE
jgi:hypothetical protein